MSLQDSAAVFGYDRDHLGAVLFGPFYGVLIGLVTNVVQGILTNPRDIPFALVNMASGSSWEWSPARPVTLPVSRCRAVPAVLAPLIGTPIAVWIYGGLTGGGTDFLFLWLYQADTRFSPPPFFPVSRAISWTRLRALFSSLCWWRKCRRDFWPWE